MAPALTIRSRWRGAFLVCGKCARRTGGFGRHGRDPLVKALRKALGLAKGRKAAFGVVETRCLGICPKRAVVVIDSRKPDRWRVVRAGADVEALAAELQAEA